MLTFCKTVRTTQLDILNKLHSLADKMSTPLHNSINATTLTNKTNLTNLTHWQMKCSRPRHNTTKKQGALLKIDQQSLHTIRQCEPHHASQLDKLDQPAKHLDNSTKSTFEHCKLGKRPTQETPPTLPAIVLDDLNSFAILFSSMSQLLSIFSKRLNFQPCKLRWLY